MLTQSMPALIQALSGSLPTSVVTQLAQALGNCNQPITHRSGINVRPSQQLAPGGLVPQNTWNINLINAIEGLDPLRPLLPPTEGLPPGPDGPIPPGIIQVPGYNPNQPLAYYGGNSFSFPTDNIFNITNNYPPGPTIVLGGETVGDTIVTQTFQAGNTYITNMNGEPAPGTPGARGPSGPPGTPGAAGDRGAAGLAGAAGAVGADGRDGTAGVAGRQGSSGRPGSRGASGLPGGRGLDGTNGRDGRQGAAGIGFPGPPGKDGKDGKDGRDGNDGADGAPGNDGEDGTTPTSGTVTFNVPTYTFDAANCTITQSGNNSITATVTFT